MAEPAPATTRAGPGFGEPSDVAHYARNVELAASRREGRAVKAPCGTLFHPHADPSKLPACVVCQDLAAVWRR